jgi:RNA binding exosome subunit
MSESSMSHRIECSRHVHAQKRNHFVVALISDDVNLLRKKLQSCLDEFVSSNFHLRIEKKSMNLRQIKYFSVYD